MEELFPDQKQKALEKTLQRMVNDKLLMRVAKGVYLNPLASSARKGWTLEEIARNLRRDSFSYVSLESMLSEWGVISQIPLGWITIMTTGPKGIFNTPIGTIEFIHTKRPMASLLERTLHDPRRPLRIATKRAAAEDLYRVGRNTNMIDLDELADNEDTFA
jgi:hypothetical protein